MSWFDICGVLATFLTAIGCNCQRQPQCLSKAENLELSEINMEINDLRTFDGPRLGFLRVTRPFRGLHPRITDRSSQFQRTRAGAPYILHTNTFRREYK
jgi:hypothetical protein